MPAPNQIVVFRTDRLGDVLMCLPTLGLLRGSLPGWDIVFVCKHDHHELLQGLADKLSIGLEDPKSFSWKGRENASALFLYAEKDAHYEAFRSRIRVRVGLFSKWWSMVLLTKGLRQRRSQSEKNEAEYNLELGRLLLSELSVEERQRVDTSLPVNDAAKLSASEILGKLEIDITQPFAVIHPGMGGSALNISVDHWKKIIERVRSQMPVLMTFGPAPRDHKLRSELSAVIANLNCLDKMTLSTLAEVYRAAKFVVAPSTGPIHLAHHVGTKTFGIFSPVLTHRSSRWAPYGNQAEVFTYSPAVQCPAKVDCLGESCPYYSCMEKTDWEDWLSRQW